VSRDEQDPTSSERRRAIGRALLGLLVGLAVGLGLTYLAMGDDPELPRRGADAPSDRDLLLGTWGRSQRATYTLEGSFRRTPEEGEVVDDPLVVVQRGEDRIALGYGSWDGVVDGRSVRCLRSGRSGGFRDCTVGGAVDRDEASRAELRELARLTDPESPVYRVTTLGRGCFLLRVVDGELPTAHGRRARYCFDSHTGALTRVRIEHADAVDEVIVTSITQEVDPADLPPTA